MRLHAAFRLDRRHVCSETRCTRDDAAQWEPGRVEFSIGGATTGICTQAPDYPMMLILGVFDFPDRPGDSGHVPSMHINRVTHR